MLKLHREGSATAACATGLFIIILLTIVTVVTVGSEVTVVMRKNIMMREKNNEIFLVDQFLLMKFFFCDMNFTTAKKIKNFK